MTELADSVMAAMTRYPELPIPDLAELVLENLGAMNPGQRRMVRLSVDYGSEILRLAAEQLLRDVSARFSHLENVPLSAVLIYLVDELGVWTRRPSLRRC